MNKFLTIDIPVLIIAYNRPLMFKRVLDAVLDSEISKLYIHIDGPKDLKDKKLIQTNLNIINRIDVPNLEVKSVVLEKNLGIRHAVPRAVSWVLSENNEVIVLEDDAIPSATFFTFMKKMLNEYKDSKEIFNISAYSCIPNFLFSTNNQIRLTNYPASYAWATWKNKWLIYNDALPNFYKIKDLKVLLNKTTNIYEAIIWRREFLNARKNLVSSWAYRWMFSIWVNNKLSLNSNVNLISYIGQNQGSNVHLIQKWKEIPITDYIESDEVPILNLYADEWMAKNVYKSNFKELLLIYLITLYLSIRKLFNDIKRYLLS